MLRWLFGSSEEDVCPNCGTACHASDVFCPKCGKNLDELYEQLPPGWSPPAKPILHIRPEYRFLALWTAATAIGMGVGQALWLQWGWIVSINLPGSVRELDSFLFGVRYDLVTGIMLGILQWLVLRGRVARSWLWIPFTTLGIVGANIADLSFGAIEGWLSPGGLGISAPMDAWLAYLLSGVVMGCSQWLVLRKPRYWAARWIGVAGIS